MADESNIIAPSIRENLKAGGFEVSTEKHVEKKEVVNEVKTPVVENKTETKTEDKTPAKKEAPKSEVIDWEAKSKELQAELEAARKVAPTVIVKELTPEDIAARQKEEDEAVLNYVVTEKKLSAIAYEKFQNSKNIADTDYVFAKYKEDNKETGLNEEELRSEFEDEYKLNSQNENVLARANKRIALEAKEYKALDFKDFANVRDEYKNVTSTKAKAATYSKLIAAAKPEIKMPFKPDGLDEAVEITVDYTDLLPEIQKELLNPSVFSQFTDEKVDTEKAINDYIISTVKEKRGEQTNTDLLNLAFEKMKLKIEIGATHPIVAPQGSGAEEKKNLNPGISKLIAEAGLNPDTTKK